MVLGAQKRPDGQESAKQGDELGETDPWGCDGGSVQNSRPAPPAPTRVGVSGALRAIEPWIREQLWW